MKRILTVIFAMAVLAGTASAQNTVEGKSHEMAEKLELSAEQKEQIRQIREAEKKEMEALKANDKLTKQQTQEARKSIHEKYREQMKNVLTAEQQKKMAGHRPAKGANHKGRGMKKSDEGKDSARGHVSDHRQKETGRGIDKLEELDLTAEQKSVIAKNRDTFRADAEAIKSNESLSREEKQAAFRKLAEKQHDAMRSILTEDQQRKLAELMRESKAKGRRK